MNSIYEFIGSLDPLWVIVLAVILIILDVFFIGTTVLLILSLGLFLFAGITFLTDDNILLTWSIPGIIILIFAAQRTLIAATVRQKLPYQSKINGTFRATIRIADDPDSSKNYFYGYKDEKHAVPNEKGVGVVFKAVLEDGRSLVVPNSDKLKDGINVKVKISDDTKIKVVKIYE